MNENKERVTIWTADNLVKMWTLAFAIGFVGTWLEIPMTTLQVVWVMVFVVFTFHKQLGFGRQKILAKTEAAIAEIRSELAMMRMLEGRSHPAVREQTE